MTTEYTFPLAEFITVEKFAKLKAFAKNKETPFLAMDLDVVAQKYRELNKNLPYAHIFYAVKANPQKEVLTLLRDQGSSFDVASSYEMEQVLALGVAPSKISFGNTIKKAKDIATAYKKGVSLFCTDSKEDLSKLAKYAPGAKVLFRILTEGSGADWPLSRKFGAHTDIVFSLIIEAQALGLVPYGVSFHVGSQQRDIGKWADALSHCKYLFDSCLAEGIQLKMINMGGGFPAHYQDPAQSLKIYTQEISRFLKDDFGDNLPEIIIEPGRSLVADAGVIVSEVISTAVKAKHNAYKWVYLDVGMFNGLIETMGEAIKYPIYVDKQGASREVILAGPTCDSMDILYEDCKYMLPDSLAGGDRVYIFSTGAYTRSYSSVEFNGFPPLAMAVLGQTKDS